MEVYCQVYISVDLLYITAQQFDELKLIIDNKTNKLNALNRNIAHRSAND